MEQEIGPQAVLLPETIDSTALTERPTRQRHTEARWHLIHSERAFTWCGLDIGYGNPRRLWDDTDEERRCQLCIGRLREMSTGALTRDAVVVPCPNACGGVLRYQPARRVHLSTVQCEPVASLSEQSVPVCGTQFWWDAPRGMWEQQSPS